MLAIVCNHCGLSDTSPYARDCVTKREQGELCESCNRLFNAEADKAKNDYRALLRTIYLKYNLCAEDVCFDHRA